MKPDFDTFWNWLIQECRDFLRLGEQLKMEVADLCAEDFEPNIDPPRGDSIQATAPPSGRVRIYPSNEPARPDHYRKRQSDHLY